MSVHACILLFFASAAHANTLVNPASGKCLDIFQGDCSDRATVELYHCTGNDNQEWHIEGGTLKNSKCGKCLDIFNNDYDDGAQVELFTCNGGDNQRWNFQDGAVVNPASGKCLDIFNFCYDDGCKVDLWTCNGGDNQKWNNPSGSNMTNQTDSVATTRKPTASSSSTPKAHNVTIDVGGECGACANSSANKCYTKFGFTDSECFCANNDGAPPAHCGKIWYDWNCVMNGQNAFIDSDCKKCVGNNGGPCPQKDEPEGPDCYGHEIIDCPVTDGCVVRGSYGCYAQCSAVRSQEFCSSQGAQWCQWNGYSCVETPCDQLDQSACYAAEATCRWDAGTALGKCEPSSESWEYSAPSTVVV